VWDQRDEEIFGSKREKDVGGWRKLYNEEFPYARPNLEEILLRQSEHYE
jgi:hypothetical protein